MVIDPSIGQNLHFQKWASLLELLHMKKSIRYATYLALGTAFISGTSVFLSKFAVKVVADPILFTTLKNSIVAIILIGAILLMKKLPEIRSLTKKQIIKLVSIGVIGGSIPFALFFYGLSMTSAMNAQMIHKTLFIWVLLLAIPFLKEKLTKPQWLGIAAIFGANLLIGGFQGFSFGMGELLILIATILWAIENVIAKTALRDLSSITVASSRMVLGSVILLFIVLLRGDVTLLSGLGFDQWGWTLLTSVFLFGYVTTWYTALKYAPASYVAALIVPATLVTNVLSAIFITHAFSGTQFASTFLYLTGIVLLIVFAKKTLKSKETKHAFHSST